MRKLTVLLMALAGALTAVVATVVLTPPVSVAAERQGINIIEHVALNAPKNLPNFDDTYQRHMGVLDVLKVPSP